MRKAFQAVTLATCGLLIACGQGDDAPSKGGAAAQPVDSETLSVIDVRQKNFKSIAGAFKKINDELKAGSPDVSVLEASVDTITPLSADIENWFPEGTGVSSGAKTEALDVIWTDPEGFSAEVEKFKSVAMTLDAAVSSADMDAIKAAVKQTGGSCKSCHSTYRLDD